MLNSTEFSNAHPSTEGSPGRSSAAHRSGPSSAASAGDAQSYSRIYMRQLWCRPDTWGRRKRLSSRGPLQLLRLVQFDRRLTPQPVRRNWIGAGASLGVPSAPRLNAFAFRGELAGCNSWPRFNASASSRHALASLSIKARCLGSFAVAAERRHSSA
jgi:hypothetical protein